MSLDRYGKYTIRQFAGALPAHAGLIVELVCNLRGLVARRNAAASKATVINVNSSQEFPQNPGQSDCVERVRLLRGDGRR